MRNLNISFWTSIAGVSIAATLMVQDPYAINLIQIAGIAALTAASLRFVLLIGEVSLATAAFVGLGAYSAGVATTILGWPFPVATLLGALVAAGVSILFGLITLRVKGPYFMLIGFAFTEAVRIAFTKIEFIGGVSGMSGIFVPQFLDPWLSTIVISIVYALLFGLYVLEKSDFGRVLAAIRDNEDIARTVGLNVLNLKVICFAIASFCAGMAGSLQAFVNTVISPGDFGFLLAAFTLAYVKVGGESSIFGAIVGAVILVLVSSFALSLGAGELFVYGGAIVLAMLLMPQGLAGLPWRKILLASAPSRFIANRHAKPSAGQVGAKL